MPGKPGFDKDIAALGEVLKALSKLEPAGQQWVLSTAGSRLNLTLSQAHSSGARSAAASGAAAGTGGTERSPKQFLKEKAPRSDVDRVACLAYFLTHERKLPAYSSRELRALNTEAAGPRMNMSRAVDNATKQNSYLTGAGKGRKQITTYGEDVVNALPDYEAAKAVIPHLKKATRKKGKG